MAELSRPWGALPSNLVMYHHTYHYLERSSPLLINYLRTHLYWRSRLVPFIRVFGTNAGL